MMVLLGGSMVVVFVMAKALRGACGVVLGLIRVGHLLHDQAIMSNVPTFSGRQCNALPCGRP